MASREFLSSVQFGRSPSMVTSVRVDYERADIEEEEVIDPNPSWIGRIFPGGFKKEFKPLLTLGWPAAFAYLFSTLMGVVSLMFCGQLGREELDSVGLAISLVNITGVSICFGVSTACDTLFSQAYGGKNKHLVGIYLQRSMIIITLVAFVCWAIHLNTEGLLILLGQDRNVSRTAGVYVLYYMPGLLFSFHHVILLRYLQTQNRVLCTVILGGFGNAVNALIQYLAVFVLQTGIVGSAIGQDISFFVMLVSTVVYIKVTGLYKETWTGWSWRALEHWGQFVTLGLAGLVMTATEWWCFEIGIFLNGLLNEVTLGATTVLFQIEQIIYMMPSGIGVASSIRMGQSLGAGRARAAKCTARVAQVFAGLGWIVVAIFLMSLRNYLPRLFTTDQEVVDMVYDFIPIIVLLAFLDCIVATSMGTLRGCGLQLHAAACNALGYVVFGVPLAAVFMFVVGLGGSGFWWGLICGISPTSCLYIYIIMFRINWKDQVLKTYIRIEQSLQKPANSETVPLIASQCENDDHFKKNVNAVIKLSGYRRLEKEQSEEKKLKKLIIKRLVSCLCVLLVLASGLCARLLIPLPPLTDSNVSNSTALFTNTTTVSIMVDI